MENKPVTTKKKLTDAHLQKDLEKLADKHGYERFLFLGEKDTPTYLAVYVSEHKVGFLSYASLVLQKMATRKFKCEDVP